MRRISATTGLMVDNSYVLYDTVGLLLEPEQGAAMIAFRTAMRRVASWKKRA